MHLLRKAVAQRLYAYYHLITASDFPIKSVEQFKQFFGKEGVRSYIEYHRVPIGLKRADWGAYNAIGWATNGATVARGFLPSHVSC